MASGPIVSSGAAFSEYDKLIGGDFFEHVHSAADPPDLDAVHQRVLSKSKVQTHAVVTLIPPTAMHFVDLHQILGHDCDARAHPISVGLGPAQANLDPVIPTGRIISEQGWSLKQV